MFHYDHHDNFNFVLKEVGGTLSQWSNDQKFGFCTMWEI